MKYLSMSGVLVLAHHEFTCQQRGDIPHGYARSAQPRTSSHPRPPLADLVRGPSVPAASVRGRPWKADGYTDRPMARTPSAIRPWMPQHGGLQRPKVTHGGTEKNGPHSRISAASGPFSQVVAGGGFEPPKAKPTVLQTSDRNGLNCGNSNRNPDLGTYRAGSSSQSRLTAPAAVPHDLSRRRPNALLRASPQRHNTQPPPGARTQADSAEIVVRTLAPHVSGPLEGCSVVAGL